MFKRYDFTWEDLTEISHTSTNECIDWLRAHGVPEDKIDTQIDEYGDGQIDVGGFWSDDHPVIIFEDGYVVRWFHSGDWD